MFWEFSLLPPRKIQKQIWFVRLSSPPSRLLEELLNKFKSSMHLQLTCFQSSNIPLVKRWPTFCSTTAPLYSPLSAHSHLTNRNFISSSIIVLFTHLFFLFFYFFLQCHFQFLLHQKKHTHVCLSDLTLNEWISLLLCRTVPAVAYANRSTQVVYRQEMLIV